MKYATAVALPVCAAAVALSLSDCAPSQSRIVPAGKDTYLVASSQNAWQSGGQPPAVLNLQAANQFCAQQGKSAVPGVASTSGNTMVGRGATTTLTFSCGDASGTQQIADACVKDYETPELDPIRHKVELYRANVDAAPPFAIASNESYPTGEERQAIAKWATLRDACIARQRAISRVAAGATPMQATFIEQDAAFGDEITGRVSALIVALYQGKMTYGEFGQRRYEFSRDDAAAEREFRQAALIADQQRSAQAEQLAQQNFQNRLLAWSTYLQTVNARQPQPTIQVQQNVTIH